MAEIKDLIIVGGGQAGLAAGYYAKQHDLNFMILDAHSKPGDSWRNRYDSLRLFTPRAFSNLPGLALSGDSNGYPAKDEIAEYLENYADTFNLPVQTNQPVKSLTHEAGIFSVVTTTNTLQARSVIIATGPFQNPKIPQWAAADIAAQFHSSEYRNPQQVRGRRVLVVGGGNSGAQIAEDLAPHYDVTLSVRGRLRIVPAEILGKSISWWLNTLRISKVPTAIFPKAILRSTIPIIGTDLPHLIKNNKVTMKPAAVGTDGKKICFSDGSSSEFDTIIWATGFRANYDYIEIPGALADDGVPLHKNGIATQVKGLYFLGLEKQRRLGSASLGGVGDDAKFLINRLVKDLEVDWQ